VFSFTHHTTPPRSTALKVPAGQNTRCHNAEDYNMAIRRHEEIRPHNIINLLRTEQPKLGHSFRVCVFSDREHNVVRGYESHPANNRGAVGRLIAAPR
jgi:hypothetical protein